MNQIIYVNGYNWKKWRKYKEGRCFDCLDKFINEIEFIGKQNYLLTIF